MRNHGLKTHEVLTEVVRRNVVLVLEMIMDLSEKVRGGSIPFRFISVLISSGLMLDSRFSLFQSGRFIWVSRTAGV